MDLQLHIGWPTARRPRAARAVAASNAVGAAALVALALVAAACATPTAPIEAPADDVADAGGYPGAVPTVFQESIGEAYPPARTGADAVERSAQLAERAGVEAVTVLGFHAFARGKCCKIPAFDDQSAAIVLNG